MTKLASLYVQADLDERRTVSLEKAKVCVASNVVII
jgi:hypothetical protein